MALEAALKILQLRQDRDGLCSISAYVVFSEQEIEFAEVLYQAKYKGQTQLQRNPHQEGTLARMSWLIARIGGWKGYQSTGRPGPITLKRGIDKFNIMYQGLVLSEFYRDVYKEYVANEGDQGFHI